LLGLQAAAAAAAAAAAVAAQQRNATKIDKQYWYTVKRNLY